MFDVKEVMDTFKLAVALFKDAAPALAQVGTVAAQLAKTGTEQLVVQKQMGDLKMALFATQTALRDNTNAVERCEASTRQLAHQVKGLSEQMDEVRQDNRRQDEHMRAMQQLLDTVVRRLAHVETISSSRLKPVTGT